MSEYTMRTPGSVSSGVAYASASAEAASVASLYSGRQAGSPEECVSRSRTVTFSLFGPGPAGEVALHRRVEVDLVLLHELHHGRRQAR